MADNNITKVSLALLPLEDLAQYLNVAEGFVTKADKATDVESVAGVDAEVIAVATSPADRTTIRNAENLGEHPASYFMTSNAGGLLATDNASIKTIYADEISNVRNELYQLRAELAKVGMVTNYNHFSGYSDAFKTADPLHLKDPIGSAVLDSTVRSELTIKDVDLKNIDVDDYVILNIKDVARYHVCKVVSKKADGMTFTFTPSTSYDLKVDCVDVYKSLGEVVNGAFCFLEKAKNIPDAKEMFTCLNDDTFRLRKQIKASHTGYAFTFRIPDYQRGFLTNMSVQLKAYGMPGAVMCYVVDERDIDKFKNPTQADALKIILAKSQPLIVDANYGEKIFEFNFWDGNKFPLLNEPDTVDHKMRYCAIIEVLSADDDNYLDMVFLQTKHADGTYGDLQLNNITYTYESKEDLSTEKSLLTSDPINSADVYYGITTRGVINDGFTPFRQGVYTAKTVAPKAIAMSKVRLMMRINREGYYTTASAKDEVYPDNSSIAVKKEPGLTMDYDMIEIGGFGLKNNTEDVIVGTDIRRITNQNASEIVVTKGLYAKKASPVYRAGYRVFLKAKLIEWNPVTCQNVLKYQERVELPLAFVMPDRIKRDVRISDRLLYEGHLGDGIKPVVYNDFELQIYWQTEYGAMYEATKYKDHFVGKIHDLVLGFDRAI